MIDLSKLSGLLVSWSRSTEKLLLGEGLVEVEPDVRLRQGMAEVLFNPQSDDLDELYYMYRGVAREEDREGIRSRGLRYDITVIRSGTLGNEYIKTAGHYHPLKPGTPVTYPEVYEVLHGRAHYLLQRPCPDHIDQIELIILITARPGDKVLIPPGFGHITINSGDDILIMSNWVAAEFSSVYEPYRSQGGGGYFELQGDGGSEFVPNNRYRRLPPLHRSPVATYPEFNLITGLPIYRVYQNEPGSLDYLVNPENYQEQFAEYLKTISPGADKE
ncbi:MAG TPA: glucose-6-phosphate isomerase [Firmicutes bacterium]|nr:glucose-6-phosphate isomerase [Bacillota bacterium]